MIDEECRANLRARVNVDAGIAMSPLVQEVDSGIDRSELKPPARRTQLHTRDANATAPDVNEPVLD
ncbi:MAG: hypothetical protein NT138_05590 [Planctomycetales bacterium]|nr:hypothetical protein [Planctomycetales bacterium]